MLWHPCIQNVAATAIVECASTVKGHTHLLLVSANTEWEDLDN